MEGKMSDPFNEVKTGVKDYVSHTTVEEVFMTSLGKRKKGHYRP